jgi:cell division septum initiation protein DivIVA
VSGDAPAAGEGILKKEFSIVRKGYAPDEVNDLLAEYDTAVRDLEEYAGRLKQELAEARVQIKRLQETEQDAVDRAMLAVFDSKERILERARQKALEIENEARLAAGMPPVSEDQLETDPTDDDLLFGVNPAAAPLAAPAPVANHPVAAPAADPPVAAPAADLPVAAPAAAPPGAPKDEPQPAEILRQMLEEADTIRNQLERGLSSAFEEIERMQRDAQTRAAELLDEARTEAERLRAAGEAGSSPIQVTLEAEQDQSESELRSRFQRNPTKLPRIGDQAGVSVLASMNQLRNKLREAEEAAAKVQDTAS